MDDRVRIALEEFRNKPPAQTEDEAERQAYMDWAITELYFREADRPFADPIGIIEDFAVEMLYYARSPSVKDKKINPFTVAYQTAQEVLASLECPKED